MNSTFAGWGALHIALWRAALAVLLAGLRGREAIAILPVVIFTDVCYAAYCNSFYMDAAALSAAVAWRMASRPRAWQLPMFTAAA
jgi:hypothetical protein